MRLSDFAEKLRAMRVAMTAAVVLALVGAGLYAWMTRPPPAPPQAVWVPAYDAAPAAPSVDVPIKSGKVRVKKSAAAALKIPLNPDEGVIAASRVASSDSATTVATIIDSNTGESRTIVRQEPLPWLALDPHGEVGMYYGVRSGGPGVTLQARQGLLQVKNVHVGVMGQVEQGAGRKADAYVGVGLWYRW